MTDSKHVRGGQGSVRPYLYGKLDLPDFVTAVFGAVELERHPTGEESCHVEARIGDSIVVIEAGSDGHPSATRGSVYVYVEDVDSVFARALEAGASAIDAPEDKPYQERGAGFRDPSGNTWWIATYTG
jgi:PhnB protein